MKEDFPGLTTGDIDAVLSYLPLLEQCSDVGQWVGGERQVPMVRYDKTVRDFMRALYGRHWIIQFDWPAWQRNAERYRTNPDLLKTARLLTLRKLLTVHVRKESFFEGHLLVALKNGHIIEILRRAEELRKRMGAEDKTK